MEKTDKSLTRRDFLKKTGQAALVGATAFGLESMLSGCANFDPNKDWSQVPPEEFDIKAFDRWFKKNKLYNGDNPNLGWRHGTMHTFKGAYLNGWSPGISYSVPFGETMLACAPGLVYSVHSETQPFGGAAQRALAKAVVVRHPDFQSPFDIAFAHINKPLVESGQKIKRGDPIGKVTWDHDHVKIMFMWRESGESYFDPDNYGANHSYMQYPTGPLKEDSKEFIDGKLVKERWIRQMQIVHNLKCRIEGLDFNTAKFQHYPGRYKSNYWAPVEEFTYLKCLYEIKPDLFPSLSNDEFQSLKKEFYGKQPIILTLPFKKP